MKVKTFFRKKGMQPRRGDHVFVIIDGPPKEVKEILAAVEQHFKEKDWEQT